MEEEHPRCVSECRDSSCQDDDLCNTLYLQRLGVTRPQWTDSRPWPP